jgi:acetate kinase
MPKAILTLNNGSSSIKFALFTLSPQGRLAPLLSGQIENVLAIPHFEARDAGGAKIVDEPWPRETFADVLHRAIGWIEDHLGDVRLVAVGHRVVHGGPDHVQPERVTAALLSRLDELAELAPLHVPHNVEPIRELAASRPDLMQVACFDTAFHATMPAVATRFGLPRRYFDAGIRRYGFHGLSYEYVAERLKLDAPNLHRGRVIAAHLGSGASLCAMQGGRSVETTMGFTALDGLLMGTRPGTLDAGAVLHIMKHEGIAPEAMEEMLYKQSGLFGVSGGLSNDMRTLLADDSAAARETVDLFVYRIIREAGALTAVMGGLDGIVFTGGIGEHSAEIRARVAGGLGWLGAVLDPVANAQGEAVVSKPESRVDIRVIAAGEEIMIAGHTRDLLRG